MICLVLAIGALLPMATSASAGDNDLGQRLHLACARVPSAQTRVTMAIARLEGGADAKGSLAWFPARIAEATAANHPRIAQDLRHRLDVLTPKLDVLHLQAGRLGRATDYCRSKGALA